MPLPILLALLLMPLDAAAHHVMDFAVPTTFWQGLLSGSGHPVLGLDHLAFIALVAVTAAASKKWLAVPGYFFAATLLGLAAAMGGFTSPYTEQLIAVSIIFGGLVLYSRRTDSRRLVYLVCGLGFFHGLAFADGIIGAENTPLAAYLLGLAAVQYGLTASVARGLIWLSAHRTTQGPTQGSIGNNLGVGFAALGMLFLFI